MAQSLSAEAVLSNVQRMSVAERARFFTMLGANAFSAKQFSHQEVFGELAGAEFTATEAAQYLEVSIATFRRYVQSGKIAASDTVGRNQLFSTKTLRVFKRSRNALKG